MFSQQLKNRPVDGVLLLNKPSGISSNAALQKVKNIFQAEKAGHTGSLDPLATGVLPICFGESTKFSQFLLNSDKTYISTFCLGVTTTTGDFVIEKVVEKVTEKAAEQRRKRGDERGGEVVAEKDASDISQAQLDKALQQFVGEIDQVPPMFSAVKHNGKPLYRLARKGRKVERQARKAVVHSIVVHSFKPGHRAEVTLEIRCGKGTYVRSIAEGLGEMLGCGACVVKLHRTESGPFKEAQTCTLLELAAAKGSQPAEVLDRFLLPVDAPVGELPRLTLSEQAESLFNVGIAVAIPEVYRLTEEGGMVRVFSASAEFIGLAEALHNGQIAPRRLVNRSSGSATLHKESRR